MSPVIIIGIDTGDEINLSRVFVLVSHGIIMGTTAVEVKKSVIPKSPGRRKLRENFLPKQKAKKRKKGSNIPYIKTGVLKK